MLFAHLTTQVGIYAFGADKNWLEALNMDRELNLPTLFSTLLLFTAARLLMQLSDASQKESAAEWTLLSRIFCFSRLMKHYRFTRFLSFRACAIIFILLLPPPG